VGRSGSSPVLGAEKSCQEYCFHLPSVFQRVPVGELVEPGRKTAKMSRPVGSAGIRAPE
jgi:hypothetical protein